MNFYCLVIARSKDKRIVLIEKQKPLWQKDKLNFVGGKLEIGEDYQQCAQREFYEETGVHLKLDEFKLLAKIQRKDSFYMEVFQVESDLVLQARTMEAEEIKILSEEDFLKLRKHQMIENLHWLYGMAFDGFSKVAEIDYSQE